jgi:hypothetical protein
MSSYRDSPGRLVSSEGRGLLVRVFTSIYLSATKTVVGGRSGNLLPDPRYDAVRCIIMAVMDDDEDVPDSRFTARMMLFDDTPRPPRDGLGDVQVAPLLQLAL